MTRLASAATNRCVLSFAPRVLPSTRLGSFQVANFLTAKENALIQGYGRSRLLPRTFSLRPGLALLLGGVARLEFCEVRSEGESLKN